MNSKNMFVTSALALAAFHVCILGGLGVTPAGVLASNLVQVASSLLAVMACVEAARRGAGASRHYWLLIAAGFFTWSVAQVIWTYHDKVNQRAQESPSPTDIIFFFAFAPFVLALIVDWQRSFKGLDWQRTLDIAQVAIVAISAYLYFFYVPAKWEDHQASMTRLLAQIFNFRNLFLTAAFSLRTVMTRSPRMRSLFGRTAAFLAVYSLLTGFTNFTRLKWAGVTGMWFDASWSLPFLFMAVLAATWKAPESSALHGDDDGEGQVKLARHGLVPAHLLGTAIPLTVLIMSAGIAREQLALASIAIVASFACYSARLAVTQHRQIRDSQTLTQTEARFRLLFSSNPHPMWVFDPATFRFLEVNDAAVVTYGYSREEFLRMSVLDIRPPEDIPRVVEKIRHTHEDGSYGQWRHRRKDGTIIHVAITTQHIQFEDRPAELVIAEDITERRQLEEQLRQSQKMEAVGTLAGGVAHDFNNLLTVITGYTKLLLDHPGNDARVTHQLQQIERAGDRAASLTRQLLAFSRRQVLQPRLLNLNDVILGMIKLLHPLIGEDIELVTRLTAAPALIQADPGQMEQVIMNMAVNAREAMARGGKLSFETRNAVSGEALGNQRAGEKSGVVLVVSDTGCGMDEQTKAHIFEPFFTTKPDTGTGLGLSTVYGIVQQSGGHISVDSEPGRGSTFRIYFPPSSQAESRRIAEPPAGAMSRGNETILVVEDDDGLRELSHKILRMNGYEVLLARRGAEAQETIQQFKGEIALMVTDVIMPGMNGVELAQRLVTERPRMKVLFMSGYTNNAIAQSGVLQPGIAFIQKPFSPADLADKIRQVLDASARRTPKA
jgi:PAS domain S-box-containing protein